MFYTPGEICKRVEGINPRAIADIAERGLVIPVKESSGAGTSRLYDKEGVFRIMVIAAMRGAIPIEKQTEFIKHIFNGKEDEGDLIICDGLKSAYFTKSGRMIGMQKDKDVKILPNSTMKNPKMFIEQKIYISSIRKFVEDNF